MIFVVYLFNVYDAQALTDRTERAKLAVGLKKRREKVESKFDAKIYTLLFKIFLFPMDNNSLMIYEFIPLLLTFQNSKKLFFVTTPRNSILSSDKSAVLANFDKIPEF